MTQQFKTKGKGERGNALFLILIAVALFAALSYAVTSSGRGSGSISNEQALITAAQITQFPAAVRTAVTRMVITGTTASSLTFASPDSTTSGVFSTTGGGAILQTPPSNIGTATTWQFKSAPSTGTGWFISGVGTDTAATGIDAFAFLNGLTLPVCTQILRGLALNTTPRTEATAVVFTGGTNEGLATQTGGATNAQTGTAASAYAFNIWNTANPTVSPQAFSCVLNGTGGNYVYYHALLEQ